MQRKEEKIKLLRKRIEKIDENIIKLVIRRLEIAKEIGLEKKRLGLEVYQPSIEEQVILRYSQGIKEGGYDENIGKELAKCIISQSKKVQNGNI
ncbi:MAG: chorismate mutase [Thermoplasmata archaeon]